jgi:hypothetical protein
MTAKMGVHLLNNTASYDLSKVIASGISAQGTGQIEGHIRQVGTICAGRRWKTYDWPKLLARCCNSAEGSLPAMTTAF